MCHIAMLLHIGDSRINDHVYVAVSCFVLLVMCHSETRTEYSTGKFITNTLLQWVLLTMYHSDMFGN